MINGKNTVKFVPQRLCRCRCRRRHCRRGCRCRGIKYRRELRECTWFSGNNVRAGEDGGEDIVVGGGGKVMKGKCR